MPRRQPPQLTSRTDDTGAFSIAAFDVDGTLTDQTGVINDATLEAIADLKRRGVEVVIATSRGPSGISTIADHMDDDWWAVTYQGALVGRFDDGLWITHVESTLDLDLAHEIADLAAEIGLPTSWHAGMSWYASALSDEILTEAEIVGDSPNLVGDHQLLTEAPHKLMFITSAADTSKLRELVAHLPSSVSHAYSHSNYVEISPIGVDKGSGLTGYLSRIGGRADELIAFGDGENDLAMFRTAAHSVAMPHAPDLVRAAASSIADHGLVSAIQEVEWVPFAPTRHAGTLD